MSGANDRPFDTFGTAELDADFDMLVEGIVVNPGLAPLARLVDDVQVAAGGPPPVPSDELVTILAGGGVDAGDLSPGACRAGRIARRYAPASRPEGAARRPAAGMAGRIGAFGLIAKAGLALAVAGAGAAGAAATGVLPDPAVSLVRRAIDVVTPFDLPDAAAQSAGRDDVGDSQSEAGPLGGEAHGSSERGGIAGPLSEGERPPPSHARAHETRATDATGRARRGIPDGEATDDARGTRQHGRSAADGNRPTVTTPTAGPDSQSDAGPQPDARSQSDAVPPAHAGHPASGPASRPAGQSSTSEAAERRS
jgi:hypothetical protein